MPPILEFLKANWRDLVAISGLIGTGAAFWQIRQTKRVAEASQEAIRNTLDQTRSAFGQYGMSTGRRLLSETKIFMDEKNWSGAKLRLNDLAEQAAQLAQSVPSDADAWADLASGFRDWEVTCRKLAASELADAPNLTAKWHKFTTRAAAQFDRHHGPFAPMGNSNG